MLLQIKDLAALEDDFAMMVAGEEKLIIFTGKIKSMACFY